MRIRAVACRRPRDCEAQRARFEQVPRYLLSDRDGIFEPTSPRRSDIWASRSALGAGFRWQRALPRTSIQKCSLSATCMIRGAVALTT